ncbi:MAG: hypothetical protein SOY65_01215 [Marinifilaceae bacterium]|nr:hypothetical protein [Marinifilaceae bacterium]
MMESKKILILGGQGNGGVIANAILDANKRGYREWECVGFLNDRDSIGTMIDGFPVMGNINTDIPKFLSEGYYFINTIYRIDGQIERIRMFENLGIPDERLATFIHPMAYVAPNVVLMPGCVVMPLVAISSGTKIGKCCLIMVAATIGHDNIIEDYCHIAAQACVGSFLHIGKGVHISLNSTIREHLNIGDYSTLGMAAVLTKDISEREIWIGSPAKFLRMAR